uniref:Uncharacterized protein n=1 Tax=Eutreptiella gymnastica TaxID=73025 RepID=A0A7S4D0D6_9EUGL
MPHKGAPSSPLRKLSFSPTKLPCDMGSSCFGKAVRAQGGNKSTHDFAPAFDPQSERATPGSRESRFRFLPPHLCPPDTAWARCTARLDRTGPHCTTPMCTKAAEGLQGLHSGHGRATTDFP